MSKLFKKDKSNFQLDLGIYIANDEQISRMLLNPFQPSVAVHIKTSHLFCRSKQMTGFYMKCNTGLKGVKLENTYSKLTIKTQGQLP